MISSKQIGKSKKPFPKTFAIFTQPSAIILAVIEVVPAIEISFEEF